MLLLALPALVGCASTAASNTKSLLATAGFQTVPPSSPQQRACFDSLPAYKLQRCQQDGKVVYAFADKKAGLLYEGGEKEYQRFHDLARQQFLAAQQVRSAQIDNPQIAWGGPLPSMGWW